MKKNDYIKLVYLLGFVLLFCFYFYFAYNSLYKYHSSMNMDVMFGTDQIRVFNDLSDYVPIGNLQGRYFTHIFTQSHPLIVILHVPIIRFVSIFFADIFMSIAFLQSFGITIMSVLMFYTFKKVFELEESISILLTLIFSFSFVNFAYSIVIDSHIYAGIYNVLLYALVFKSIFDDKYSKKYYFAFIIISLFSFGINVINIVHFLAMLLLLTKFNDNLKSGMDKLMFYFKTCFIFFCFTIVLAVIQEGLWVNTMNYAVYFVQRFIYKSDLTGKSVDSLRYISAESVDLLNWLKDVFLRPLVASMQQTNGYVKIADNNLFLTITSFVFMLVMSLFNLLKMIKDLKYIKIDKQVYKIFYIRVVILITFVIYLVIFYFFDPQEAFMFTPIYYFMNFYLLGLSFIKTSSKQSFDKKNIKWMIVKLLFFCFLIIEIIANTITTIKLKNFTAIHLNFSGNNSGTIKSFLWLIVALAILVFTAIILKKKIYTKIKVKDIRAKYCIYLSLFIILVIFGLGLETAKVNYEVDKFSKSSDTFVTEDNLSVFLKENEVLYSSTDKNELIDCLVLTKTATLKERLSFKLDQHLLPFLYGKYTDIRFKDKYIFRESINGNILALNIMFPNEPQRSILIVNNQESNDKTSELNEIYKDYKFSEVNNLSSFPIKKHLDVYETINRNDDFTLINIKGWIFSENQIQKLLLIDEKNNVIDEVNVNIKRSDVNEALSLDEQIQVGFEKYLILPANETCKAVILFEDGELCYLTD